MRRLLCAVGTAVLILGLPAGASADDAADSGAGTKLMLVLDASGSMADPASGGGGSRIDAARTALEAVIDAAPDAQRVGFRVFGAADVAEDDPAACTDSERIVDLGASNRDALREAVRAYEPVGWTPTSHALRAAAEDLGDEGQRTIVLLSDGEPTCDPDPCEVAGEIAASGVDVKIDVVGLDVSGAARDTLACVAQAGGGTYYDANDAQSLTDSLVETSVRASRPFDLTGEPIEGTADPAAAPTIESGQYLDVIPDDGPIHYRFTRSAPGTTVHVGAVFRGGAGSAGDSVNIGIAVDDEQQTWCNTGSAYGIGVGARSPINYGATSSWRSDPESVCSTRDDLLVAVEPIVGSEHLGTPIEIAVYEEPPLTEMVTAGDTPEQPVWTALTPERPTDDEIPGTSNANAPILDEGTYAFDINPGETQVVGIPLGWGEDLQAQFDAKLTDEVREAAAVGSAIDVDIVNPVRGSDAISFYADEPEDWTTGALGNIRENIDFRTGAQTYTVDPAQRASNKAAQRGASVAGVRYVQVVYNVRGDEANLPYTLTLKRNSSGDTEPPAYEEVEGLSAPEADSRLLDAAATLAEHAPAEEEAIEDSGIHPVVWLLAGVGGVLVVAVGALAMLRRRSADRPS